MAQKEYKQLCFNELTLSPFCEDDKDMFQRVSCYAKTLKEAQCKLGVKVIRYHQALSEIFLSADTSLQTYCSKHRRDAETIAILSSHTMPLGDSTNQEAQNVFENTMAVVAVGSKDMESRGLAAAYSYNVPSIGFASDDSWKVVMHDVTMTDLSNETSFKVNWPCLTQPEHFEQDDFQKWLSERKELDLVTTEIPYQDKIRHIKDEIRDDHGKDILIQHAKILCHSDYVVGILTSLPFRPKYSDYIDKVYPDGLIDIVLHRDDRGLSMRVKTTGRNIQETTAIAAILKKKYNR